MRGEWSVFAGVWIHQKSPEAQETPQMEHDGWGQIQRAGLQVQSQVRRGICWGETGRDREAKADSSIIWESGRWWGQVWENKWKETRGSGTKEGFQIKRGEKVRKVAETKTRDVKSFKISNKIMREKERALRDWPETAHEQWQQKHEQRGRQRGAGATSAHGLILPADRRSQGRTERKIKEKERIVQQTVDSVNRLESRQKQKR